MTEEEIDSHNIPQPPHDKMAEIALLASCMENDGEALTSCIAAGLDYDAFYHVRHGIIFTALMGLQNEGEPTDEVSLIDWLRGRTVGEISWLKAKARMQVHNNLLDFCGGIAAIVEIPVAIEVTDHWKHWLEILLSQWKLRQIITLCRKTISEAMEHQAQIDVVVAAHQSAVIDLTRNQGSSLRPSDEFILASWNQMDEERMGTSDTTAFGTTGLIDLDAALRGFRPGRLHIIAARPSMGKSALAGQCVLRSALDCGVPSLVFSLEMSAEEWGQRMICSDSGSNYERFTEGLTHPALVDEMVNSMQSLRSSHLWIEESVILNIDQMRAVARNWASQHVTTGGIIAIDYAQLMSPINSRDPREQQISQIARGAKIMAKELNLPVILLAQVNREVENRTSGKLRLSDLRESGALEQDADVVLFINPTEKDGNGKYIATGRMDLDIAKFRGGSVKTVPSTFRPEITRFENYAHEQDDQ